MLSHFPTANDWSLCRSCSCLCGGVACNHGEGTAGHVPNAVPEQQRLLWLVSRLFGGRNFWYSPLFSSFFYKKKSMNAGCSPVDCSYESHTENGNLVYSVSSSVQCLNSMPSTPSIDSEYAVTLNYVNPTDCSGTLYAAGYSPASTCIPFAVTVEGTTVITYASVSRKFLIIIYFLS